MSPQIKTDNGIITGLETESGCAYLGIKYAEAKRFKYAVMLDLPEGNYEAKSFGPACEQHRTYFQDLTIPERQFYHREFREGLDFTYSEDCLNLNIYTPKEPLACPVLVFIHGGGFNSMANSEGYLDGAAYTKRGIILVTINYRVGIFGYLTHENVYREFGHDGNFGLDDQLTALKWVKKNISVFGGNPDNITVMGQSAGAISTQYLCLMKQSEGLIKRAVMLSGAGAFPKFALPRKYTETRDYWNDVIKTSDAESFEAFCELTPKQILAAVETVKKLRKDTAFMTMPVVDDYYLSAGIDKLIKSPLPIPYIAGITNNDMYTIILAHIAAKYTRATKAFMYFFDMDAPGDNNQAFHSSDLRYVFGTLSKSFRPYSEKDEEISELMLDYLADFIKKGDPNGGNRPIWTAGRPALSFNRKAVKMKPLPIIKLLRNTFKGDPK